MRRWLPTPWLSLSLLALWLLLNQSLSPGHWILGIVLGLLVPLATRPLRPAPVRFRRPLVVIRLLGVVFVDVIRSNLAVGRGVLRSRRQAPRPVFMEVPLAIRDANALAALAVIASVVPGTVWLELSLDRSRLLVHVFDVAPGEDFVGWFKGRYEAPLKEIFE